MPTRCHQTVACLALLLLVAASSACQTPFKKRVQNASADGPVQELPGGPFLSKSDLEPEDSATADSTLLSLVTAALVKEDFIYNTSPAEKLSTDCFVDLPNKAPVQASAAKAVVVANIDLTACMRQRGEAGASYTAVSMKIYLEITCQGGDLSVLNGKTFGAISDTKATDGCSSGSVRMDVMAESQGAFTAGSAQGAGTFTVHGISSMASADLSPCTSGMGSSVWSKPCIRTIKNAFDIDTDGKKTRSVDYLRLTTKDLVAKDPSATWPSSGQIEVVSNDWTGVLTYSDGKTPPTYELSQAGGQKQTGSLATAVASSGLNLTAPASPQRLKLPALARWRGSLR